MKKYKKKAAHLLLTVFTVILLSTVFQSQDLQIEEIEEITVIHKHEHSGETPGNISRSFVDQAGFENRVFQAFTCQTLEAFHSQLSHTGYMQNNFDLVQFTAPVKVYILVQKFLI